MRVLVTGGSGFLGGGIITALLDRGERVTSLSRAETPHLAKGGGRCITGYYGDDTILDDALEGIDTVFHVAAKVGMEGGFDDFYKANTLGTEIFLEACRRKRVKRFVYTSSPSVVFDGNDHEGVDESAPYPESYLAHYPHTKALAEKKVIAANGAEMATCALRPHLIWGPGDRNLIPRLVARSRAGKLRRVGEGRNRVDTVYIDNAVTAHLQAAEKLAPGSPVAGSIYFITQGEPVNCWEFINQLLATQGEPPVTKKISAGTAYALGALLESLYALPFVSGEPMMTRFVALQLSRNHWFSINAARSDFGYDPEVSTAEGLRRLANARF